MYYEYNESEYCADTISEMSNSSLKNDERKLMQTYKLNDPDYYNYKITTNDSHRIKIELYSTPSCRNAYIRHAISGSKCPHRAGTNQENLYFTVIDTTCSKSDERNKSYGVRTLYYYSPEEYESHTHRKVSKQVKESWQIKYMIANRRYNK